MNGIRARVRGKIKKLIDRLLVDRWVFFLLKKIGLRKAKIDLFHLLYYNSGKTTYGNTYWMGTAVEKNPCDLWIYQEIIYELKPDFIIECGTQKGGSAFYFASLFDLIGNGQIITIDINGKISRPVHHRITYLTGSSTSPEIVSQVKELTRNGSTILVSLDSDHSMNHVLKELNVYSELVTPGSYIVVEDSNINGHPVFPQSGPGPMEAIYQFLNVNKKFKIDKAKEKFLFTFNPNGYLKRIE
ncbi:MAG TPA: CmcI family methyltransferase [Candidatus Lokiarchaeia archaeon]|nr:CmcI family methyltransferase [Candidatus Lokiarchaeia archaeon]